MIHIEKSLTMNAAPEAVWAVLQKYMHIDEFAPGITAVDALTKGEIGLGSKRRNHFVNGTSLVETVTRWQPGQGYSVALSEMAAMPLQAANSQIRVTPVGGQARVSWSFEFQAKYGLIGWLMGQTMMRLMMGKIIMANLHGLADKAGQQ